LAQRLSILMHARGEMRFTTEFTEEIQRAQSGGIIFYRNSNSVGATGWSPMIFPEIQTFGRDVIHHVSVGREKERNKPNWKKKF